MTTPRTEAIAFRMWAYCEPLGWNCTFGEVAEHLGVNIKSVVSVATMRKWTDRMRGNPEPAHYRAVTHGFGPMHGGRVLLRDVAELRARPELDE